MISMIRNRRSALFTGVLATALLFASLASLAGHAGEEPQRSLEILRDRYLADLHSASVSEGRARELMETIRDDGSWPGINYEDVSRTGFEHSQHIHNLLVLARAYAVPQSGFHEDQETLGAALAALDFWLEHDFISDNWWYNQIGVPHPLVDALLLLDSELSDRQRAEGAEIVGRANLEASGARPGGDLVKIAEIMSRRGIFERDAEVVAAASQAIEDELRITTRRGIQPDFSFHHRRDGVITVSYGSGYATAVADYATQTKDTVFQLPAEKLQLLVDLELNGLRWMRVHGIYSNPGVMNREISRRSPISSVGPGRVNQLLDVTDYRRGELEELAAVRAGDQEPAFSGNRFFWRSDYLAHQQPGYYASVRMFSSRNHSTEGNINEEGLKNHHLADGSNFISRTGREYEGVFPVWDWRKIPGTTVVQKPELPGGGAVKNEGLTDFVGGASDGEYGFAAFDFESPLDPLKARKAWFFFDDEYVCLGAGVQSEAEYPVATTLNQSRLNGAVAIGRNGAAETLVRGEHELEGVSWLHHDDIAYIFFEPVEVRVMNDEATGHQRRINHQSWATDDEIARDIFKGWVDHGPRPEDAAYAYMVAPGADVDGAAAYGEGGNPVQVLANETTLQAVEHSGLNITHAAFYAPGALDLSDGVTIGVNEPCLVMIRREGGALQSVTVADPTQNLETLELNISAPLDHPDADWDSDAGVSRIEVTLPADGYAGQSVVIGVDE